jgi:hypothetical protein
MYYINKCTFLQYDFSSTLVHTWDDVVWMKGIVSVFFIIHIHGWTDRILVMIKFFTLSIVHYLGLKTYAHGIFLCLQVEQGRGDCILINPLERANPNPLTRSRQVQSEKCYRFLLAWDTGHFSEFWLQLFLCPLVESFKAELNLKRLIRRIYNTRIIGVGMYLYTE